MDKKWYEKIFGKLLGMTGEVPLITKVRYGIGSAGDELPYALFYTYFMMYLTEVAGIPPIIAGIISAVAAAADGLVDPALGIFSDNLNMKIGTRRRGMQLGLGPLAIVTILLFVPTPFEGAGELVYYAVFSILFVGLYSLYNINFIAMGSELTESYEERNFMRLVCGLFAPLFAYLGHAGPQLTKVILPDMDTNQQWFATGLSVTVIYFICCLFAVYIALSPKKVSELKEKGEFHQVLTADEEEGEKVSFFGNIGEILKIKSLLSEIVMVFSFSMGNGFFYALIAYVLSFSMNLSAGQQALFWAVEGVAYYVTVVLCVPVANVFGKKPLFMVCFGIAALIMILFFFLPITNLVAAIMIMIGFTLIEAPYWTLYYTFSYEISDIDEFASGKRRMGLVLSCATLLNKVGPTVSYIFTGIILSSIGYVEGGVDQASSVAQGLHGYITLLPGLCLLLGFFGALFYPVTRKAYDALQKNLKAKKMGEDYTTEGFEFLLPKYYKKEK